MGRLRVFPAELPTSDSPGGGHLLPPAEKPSRSARRMTVLLDSLEFSGGRKVLLDYARFLEQRGHAVQVLVRGLAEGPLAGHGLVTPVPDFSAHHLPESDLLIASTLDEIESAVAAARSPVVHFCQGDQVADLEQRLREGVVPVRLQGSSLRQKWRLARKRWSWRRRIARLDRLYRLQTRLVVVAEHLRKRLEARYGRPVSVCSNGVRREHFFAGPQPLGNTFRAEAPCRVVCVGDWGVTCKGIADTTESVRRAKARGCPVRFIRVSPVPFPPAESSDPAIDEFHAALTPAALGGLLRSSDVFVSNSLEAEGFGLPAMEALACGLPAILTGIPSYLGFAERRDFCVFVPQRKPEATADAFEQLISGPRERRAELRDRALDVAAAYSFERSCQRFAELMERFAAAEPRPLARAA